MEVNIKKYAPYFHDGNIRKITHKKDKIILIMESSELLPEWNEDELLLSKRNTLSGKLHITGVTCVIEEKEKELPLFGVKYPYINANICDFEVQPKGISLRVFWIKYPYEESNVFEYEILANEIYWENIPALSDEYWDSLGTDQPSSRKFSNVTTGEAIRYDYGEPNSYCHDAADHYHKYNPNSPKGRVGDCVRFLDSNGKSVPRGCDGITLYPPEGVTWERKEKI